MVTEGYRKGVYERIASGTGLEREVQAAAHRPRGLHQVHGTSVLVENRHVALRQQIPQIDQHLDVPGENYREPREVLRYGN